MIIINDVRNELRLLGDSWKRQTLGLGCASESNILALKETCRVGCAIQGTSHLLSHRADNIKVPEHIAEIGNKIDALKLEYKQ